MTLPLIHTLNQASPKERRKLINLVKRHHTKPAAVAQVMNAITQGPGMAYAQEKMILLRNDAVDLLRDIPNNATKEALIGLVDYTIERKK
jgi:octaprenyl-diphosphate synthase